MKKTKTKTTRRPYCKPQMEKVQLVPEEAVLASCKGHGGTNEGPGDFNCPEGPPAEAKCFDITS